MFVLDILILPCITVRGEIITSGHTFSHNVSFPRLPTLKEKNGRTKSRKVCDVRQKFQSGKREIGSPITSQLLNFDIMFPGNVVHTQCYLYVNCNNSPPPLSNVLRVLLRSRQNIGWPFPGFVKVLCLEAVLLPSSFRQLMACCFRLYFTSLENRFFL